MTPHSKSPKKESLSYEKSGVSIDLAEAAKTEMEEIMKTNDKRVLTTLDAFAALFDGKFPDMTHPVLVLKTEEPGTKQKLAIEHGSYRSICYDTVNHLINDIAVMGATPLAVQDAIICGKLEKLVVTELVRGFADACREQGCVLTGGETSEQPGVIEAGTYILVANVVGVVDRAKIIDGSAIREGDSVIAVASSGLHTNGYSLVRALMAKHPDIVEEKIDGRTFIDTILTPHKCYYQAIHGLFDLPDLHGMGHITGGGISANLGRILPKKLDAEIDLSTLQIPSIFRFIRERGNVADDDMLKAFNMGVGLTIVAAPGAVDVIRNHLSQHGCESNVIGNIASGTGIVRYTSALSR
jgi:phosphoribosylformylglycinamidine cyclo-ligase